MRLTFHQVLPCSPQDVWELLIDPAQLARWQPTLQAADLLQGVVGRPGAVTRLTYCEGGRTIVLTETIIAVDAPHVLRCSYTSAAMEATITNTLNRLKPELTSWKVVQDVQLLGWLRPAGMVLRPVISHKFRADMARLHALIAGRVSAGGAP